MIQSTDCSECLHQAVCAKKEEYKEAVKTVENVHVCLEERKTKPLNHVAVTVTIECDYYLHGGISERRCLDGGSN